MPAFDDLKSAAFGGVSFSVRRYNVRGNMRDHAHEFPHAPGSLNELFGRRAYMIEMDADFSENDRARPNAWSQSLPELRRKFERGERADLYVPTLGTIERAYCTDWDVSFDARRRDGETTRFVFREDMQRLEVVEEQATTKYQNVAAQVTDLSGLLDAEDLDPDFFSAVMSAATDLVAVVDSAELQADVMASKAEGLAAACRMVDETVEGIKAAEHWRVARAVRDLGATAVAVHQDALRKLGPTMIFTVPTLMTITDVSRAMYGDTDHQLELLQLNGFDDPYAIFPGAVVRGYLLSA